MPAVGIVVSSGQPSWVGRYYQLATGRGNCRNRPFALWLRLGRYRPDRFRVGHSKEKWLFLKSTHEAIGRPRRRPQARTLSVAQRRLALCYRRLTIVPAFCLKRPLFMRTDELYGEMRQ